MRSSRAFSICLFSCVFLSMGGCLRKSTPPGPNAMFGGVEGGSYLLLRWEEGLAVMLWFDVENVVAGGHGSTEDTVHRYHGAAASPDGRRVEWEIETEDGVTASLRIGGTEYDISSGRLFLVTAEGENVRVEQLDQDFSGVHDRESAVAFGKNNPEVSRFLEQ